ncbi:hypothetical protein GCM10023403_43090 [Pseudonocardia benzenivorans]|nr:hypothetical protein PSD17_45950 [Pseudonocardia sp. D17]
MSVSEAVRGRPDRLLVVVTVVLSVVHGWSRAAGRCARVVDPSLSNGPPQVRSDEWRHIP